MLWARFSIGRPRSLRQQVKHLRGARREVANAQLRVQKHRTNVGAGEEVLHVVAQLGQIADLALVLGVDGVELLVDAL